MRNRFILIVPLSMLVAFPAAAQSPDSAYCSALAEKYDSYIDTQGDKGGRGTPPDIVAAVGQCRSNPGAAIPVLEKALKAARLDLPPH
jgi:hypothetical protein